MRPLTANISLSNLRRNYDFLKQKHGGQLLAVIKADAYGHGAVACARALPDADGFAVAFVEEAQILREAGIDRPIVLLEGVFDAGEYEIVDRLRLSPVVHNGRQLSALSEHSWTQPVDVWLKLDTGMRRAGFSPDEYAAAHHALTANPAVRRVIKITHLCCADDLSSDFTARQLRVFDDACRELAGSASIANSAAILAHPSAHRDIGRAGIALYGISPFEDGETTLPGDRQGSLKPVMTLNSEVFAERLLRAGEAVGYGAIFRAPRDMRIGLVACGYADGYPRLPSNDNPVLIDGKPARVVGRVSMDMLTVELNDPGMGVGSAVELWGEGVSVAEIARRAGTISYEILCRLKRAQRVYSS